jgi:hypothetical protein
MSNEQGERDLPSVLVRSEPFTFMNHGIKRITTTATKKPDKADLTYKNPMDMDIRALIVSFIPDAAFKTKGNLVVNLNGSSHLEIATGDLTDVDAFDMHTPDVNDILDRQNKVEFFIWNGVDAAQIALTVGFTFGAYA